LTVGASFGVRLPENRTTGYRWRIQECDRESLEVVRDEFQAPATARAGAGGEHVWEFLARAPARSRLRLGLGRSWEPTALARTFELDVSVQQV
jgi:predicted secreted protein